MAGVSTPGKSISHGPGSPGRARRPSACLGGNIEVSASGTPISEVQLRVDPVAGVRHQTVRELAARAAVQRLQEHDVQDARCTLQPPSPVSAAPMM